MSKHITIDLFEAYKTPCETFVRNLQNPLKQYGLIKKIIVYVKDERSNLNTMIVVLRSIMSCETLGVVESF
jgi:hypothetical protein